MSCCKLAWQAGANGQGPWENSCAASVGCYETHRHSTTASKVKGNRTKAKKKAKARMSPAPDDGADGDHHQKTPVQKYTPPPLPPPACQYVIELFSRRVDYPWRQVTYLTTIAISEVWGKRQGLGRWAWTLAGCQVSNMQLNWWHDNTLSIFQIHKPQTGATFVHKLMDSPTFGFS